MRDEQDEEGDISSVESKELVGRKRTARLNLKVEDTSYLEEISESDESDKHSKLGKRKRNMKSISQNGGYKSYPYGVSSEMKLGPGDISVETGTELLGNVACGELVEFQEQV